MGMFLRSMAFTWLLIQFVFVNWGGQNFLRGPFNAESFVFGISLFLIGNFMLILNVFLLAEKDKIEAYLSRNISSFSVKALTAFNSLWLLWIGFMAYTVSGPFT